MAVNHYGIQHWYAAWNHSNDRGECTDRGAGHQARYRGAGAMKYFDIIPAPDDERKLVAWIEFCIARRKAIEGKKIKVGFVTRKPEVREDNDDGYDYGQIPF
jgi:hypothetical protein